jgi:hypothetical protein
VLATEAESRLLTVVRVRDEINALSRALLGPDDLLFADVSLETPKLTPAELGFLRTVAWLYVQYFESGGVGVRFVSTVMSTLDSAGLEDASAHLERVGRLRTLNQHNLNPRKKRDHLTQTSCEAWFLEQCGTRRPGHEDHWTSILLGLLDEATSFFQWLLGAVRQIEADGDADVIVDDWRFRLRRHHPPERYDVLVAEAAADMGRDFLDAVRFRKRFYERWSEAITSLEGDYDFEREARRLIEHSLLSETAAILPVTGSDIIDAFGLAPGPAVGQLLEKARRSYAERPCGRDELLSRLREQS